MPGSHICHTPSPRRLRGRLAAKVAEHCKAADLRHLDIKEETVRRTDRTVSIAATPSSHSATTQTSAYRRGLAQPSRASGSSSTITAVMSAPGIRSAMHRLLVQRQGHLRTHLPLLLLGELETGAFSIQALKARARVLQAHTRRLPRVRTEACPIVPHGQLQRAV